MAVQVTGRLSHACVIVGVHTVVHPIHTVFSFTMFTATFLLCNSFKYCLKLEISRNNFPGIVTIHQGENREISQNFVCLKYWKLCVEITSVCSFIFASFFDISRVPAVRFIFSTLMFAIVFYIYHILLNRQRVIHSEPAFYDSTQRHE